MSDPSDPQSVVAQAGMLLERRRLDQARTLIASGLEETPDDPDLLFLRGFADYLDDRYDEAEEILGEVLAIKPHHEGARGILYHVLSESGRLGEAEAILLGLLEEYPEEPDYYAWYSLLMMSAGFFAKAEKLAEEAVRRGPEDEDPLMAAAICATVLHPSDTSRQRLAELVRRYPDSRRTLTLLAGTLAERGELKKALGIYQELLRSDPHDESLVDAVVSLKAATHWSSLPLWPMRRFGWAGAAGVWVMIVALSFLVVPLLPPSASFVSFVVIVTYVVYSWTHPPLLRWLLRR